MQHLIGHMSYVYNINARGTVCCKLWPVLKSI